MKPIYALRFWGTLAGLSGAVAVIVASWASHGLAQSVPPEALELAINRARTATQQHLLHTLAILGVGLWLSIQPGRSRFWLQLSASLFSSGILLFSGGIYVLHLWWPQLGAGGLRYIVPMGGIAFITGWLALAVAGYLSSPENKD